MNLAAKSLRAAKSNYIGTVVRVGAQLGAQVLIMRQLGPELIGVFGYALLLHGLLALIIDQGFGWSLIKGDFNDGLEIATVFSRILLASLLCVLFVFFISYPVAVYLDNELVGAVFRYTAPSYLLIGFFALSQARLRAELRFKEIQTATTGAYLIAYLVVGVSMAMAGFGVWALVLAWYLQGILQVIIGHYYSPHSLRLANPLRSTKSGPLGRQVAGINVLNWAVDNSSGVFVGGLGASSLGNFNAASMLARTPALHLVHVLQTILFSTASAIGDDQRRIKSLYLSALAVIGFIILPAYSYILTHANWIVLILFGEKWSNASDILSALAVGMMALSASTLSGSILTATGDQKAVIYSQLVCLLLMVSGLYLSVNIDLVYVGVAITIAYIARLLMQLRAISTRGGIAPSEFVSTLKGPFLLSILMGVPVSYMLESNWDMVWVESSVVFLKGVVLLVLIKLFPDFFLSPPLINILIRFSIGRRILATLGSK